MHIPDGYLSPSTCAVGYLAMLPIWAMAVKKVKKALNTRLIPLMVIGASFSFVLMMFNVPIPGGTTAHAVGGGILAVILGPWAATICISIALAIQALLFGDGGLLTFGFNCFNMAVVIPFVTWFIYQGLAGQTEATSSKRWIWAAIGSYIGINLAGLANGIELGLQPLLFHTAPGVPLYAPYPIWVSVPTMLLAHALVAGPVEAIVTGLVTRYFQATNPAVIEDQIAARLEPVKESFNKLWGAIIGLVLLVPLGLLASGGAFGEDSAEDIKKALGYVPDGLASLGGWFHALLQDYGIPNSPFAAEATDLLHQSIGYYAAAVVGIAIIAGLTIVVSRLVAAREDKPTAEA
jgi:cobalt/nickel transport system permease protein